MKRGQLTREGQHTKCNTYAAPIIIDCYLIKGRRHKLQSAAKNRRQRMGTGQVLLASRHHSGCASLCIPLATSLLCLHAGALCKIFYSSSGKYLPPSCDPRLAASRQRTAALPRPALTSFLPDQSQLGVTLETTLVTLVNRKATLRQKRYEWHCWPRYPWDQAAAAPH